MFTGIPLFCFCFVFQSETTILLYIFGKRLYLEVGFANGHFLQLANSLGITCVMTTLTIATRCLYILNQC